MDSNSAANNMALKSENTTNKGTADDNFSLLLNLPPEIRNMVCHYSLTHDDALIYMSSGQSNSHPYLCIRGKNVEYNQIKFVNRQLHSETAGLELMHNKIEFQGPERRFSLPPSNDLTTAVDYLSNFTLIRMGPIKCN
jgi:hypothetical protein